MSSSDLRLLLLDAQSLGCSLDGVSIYSMMPVEFTYIVESRHLQETDVFGSIRKRLMSSGKGAILQVLGSLVAIDQDTVFCEVGLAGIMEVFIGGGHFVEIEGSFGSFRIW